MPRSKRDKVISLTKTGKKATKESRAALIDEVRSLADSSDYVWLFSIEHFRNQHLQEIRKAWKPSRCVKCACPVELLRGGHVRGASDDDNATLTLHQDSDGTQRGHADSARRHARDRAQARLQSDR